MRKIVGVVKLENGNVRLMYEDGKSYVTLQGSAKLIIVPNNTAIQIRQQNDAHEYIFANDLQYTQILPNAQVPFDSLTTDIFQLKELLEEDFFFNLGGTGALDFGLTNDIFLPSYHRFYCGDVKSGTSSDTIVLNNLYAYPFIVPKQVSVSQIGCKIITTNAGKKARIGVYTNSNCSPDALLIDVEIDLGSASVQYGTFTDVVLEPGIYWYAFLAEASVSWRSIQPDWEYPAILGTTGAIDGSGYTRIGRAFAYQPNLPSTFGSGNSRFVTNNPIFNLYCS